jgi:hypothetical protein
MSDLIDQGRAHLECWKASRDAEPSGDVRERLAKALYEQHHTSITVEPFADLHWATKNIWLAKADAILPITAAEQASLVKECRRLERERDGWKTSCAEWKALAIKNAIGATAAEARNSELEAEVARLTTALTTYAEKVADCRKIHKEGEEARTWLDRDGGKTARAALNPTTAEEGAK